MEFVRVYGRYWFRRPSFREVIMSFFLRVLGLDTAPRPIAVKPKPVEAPAVVAEPEVVDDDDASVLAAAYSEASGSAPGGSEIPIKSDEPRVVPTKGDFQLRATTFGKLRLDAGAGDSATGFARLSVDSRFDPGIGFGWIDSTGLEYRDRKIDDGLLGQFVYSSSHNPTTLRVALDPGSYRVTILMGDLKAGNHILQVSSDGIVDELPELTADAGAYAVLIATARPVRGFLDLTFASPTANWVLNMVEIRPAADGDEVGPRMFRRAFSDTYADIL